MHSNHPGSTNASSDHQQQCLSLADGFQAQCEIVLSHNQSIGAKDDDIILIPDELAPEFSKLSGTLQSLSRGYELGIIHE
jgi:hypothetical protein